LDQKWHSITILASFGFLGRRVGRMLLAMAVELNPHMQRLARELAAAA
jgi:hypothetical protein